MTWLGRRPAAPVPSYDEVPARRVPPAVAFEAITAQLAHDEGRMSHDDLVRALTAIVSDVHTQADAFELLARVVKVASSSLESAARGVGADPAELLREAALEFSRQSE